MAWEKNNGWELIGKLAVGVFLGTPARLLLSLWRAFVLSILWGWFIVPIGIPALTTLQIWGALIVYGALRPSSIDTDSQRKEKDAVYQFVSYSMMIVGPLIDLGLGFIIKLIIS